MTVSLMFVKLMFSNKSQNTTGTYKPKLLKYAGYQVFIICTLKWNEMKWNEMDQHVFPGKHGAKPKFGEGVTTIV